MKIFEKIFSSLCYIMLLLILVYYACYGFEVNGILFLIIFSLFTLYPLSNFGNCHRIYIHNYLYLSLGTIFCIFNSIIYVLSIIKYYKFGHNESSLFSFNTLLYSYSLALIILLIKIFINKEKKVIKNDYINLSLVGISVLSLLPLLNESLFKTSYVIGYGLGIFCLILILKKDDIYKRSEWQKLYTVMFLISIYSSNYVGAYIIFHMYRNMDYQKLV